MKILVLDDDFRRYQGLLSAAGVQTDAGSDPGAFTGSYDVLLGQPDLAAQFLQLGHCVPWVQSTWAGVDRLIPACQDPDMIVTGIKGVFGPQMAEYVFAFLLQQSRDLEALLQQQRARVWSPSTPDTLVDKQMLILGTGSIGRHLAGVARAFGMQTLGVSRSGRSADHFNRVAVMDELAAVATEARVVVNTLPSTPETRGVLNSNLFQALPDNAMLINPGRGDALCELSLRNWLDAKPYARAVLDVFAREPLPADHWLWQHRQVAITPHVAAVSRPEDVVAVFLGNLQRWRADQSLEHVIDRQQGY